MRRTSGQVNIPIAIASLAISVLLFFIVLPNWMSRRLRPIVVPLAVPYGFDSKHFYIEKQPTSIRVYANLTDKEFEDLTGAASGEANLTEAQAGTKQYPVSIYPDKFRKVVQDQDPKATYTLQALKSREVVVDVSAAGKTADPTQILDNVKPESKKVTVEGPERDVSRVVKARGTLRLDMLDLHAAQQLVALEAVDAEDRVVERVDLHPTQVMVTAKFSLAPEQKQVFVQPVFDDHSLPPGFIVKNYSVDPQSVIATGSSLALSRIASVKTEKINLSRVTGNQTLLIPLKPFGSGVTLNPASVAVTLNVEIASLNRLSPKTPSNRPARTSPPESPGGLR